jgi:Na+-translocating ferredoxin:NAD+ oxidoreductase RnfC subunit
VRVPIGTSIEETVHLAGAATTPNPVYFIGGPMMGFIGSGSQPVTKTTNAVLVLPESHYIIQKKRQKVSIDLKRAAACCCQCSMCTDLCPRNRLGHPIEPHLFMRAATCKDVQKPDIFVNTFFCSSCGLCEMYSCFQGLSPRTLMAEYKAGLRSHGLKPPAVVPKPVGEEREYRKVPMERLMARLDLTKYNREAPLDESAVPVRRVKIMLSQHIGAPASPIVKQGDTVAAGQMIAEPAKGLSVGIHASIDGVVKEVSEKYVIIETQEGRAGK